MLSVTDGLDLQTPVTVVWSYTWVFYPSLWFPVIFQKHASVCNVYSKLPIDENEHMCLCVMLCNGLATHPGGISLLHHIHRISSNL